MAATSVLFAVGSEAITLNMLGSINQPPGQIAIGIDAAVAQKWPMRAGRIHFAEVQWNDQDFFFVRHSLWRGFRRRCRRQNFAPRTQCRRRRVFHGRCGLARQRNNRWQWHGCVGSFPRRHAALAVLSFLLGVPADRGGIKKNFRALHRRQSRGFGIPLVPADQHADLGIPGLPGAEAEIARREIKLLVKERIIRDVHLAIDAQQAAVGIDDGGGVVINAGGALFEQRGDDDDAVLLREFLKGCGGRAGDRLGELEIFVVFRLAKILRAKKFLGANDLRALFGRAVRARCRVFFRLAAGSAEQAV